MPETIISAFTINVKHTESDYGIFTYNEQGDLFLSCDYGFYGYNWRRYGKDNPFENFLAQCNADYIRDKFELNMRYLHKKGMPAFVKPHVKNLLTLFLEQLNKKIVNEKIHAITNTTTGSIN